jgi:lantibiotic modifying enzyme
MCRTHRSDHSDHSAHSPSLTVSRREAITAGVTAAASFFALPSALRAMSRLTPEAGPADLDVALEAARWIRTARVETPRGVVWPADPLKKDSVSTDLYNGFPGVVLFHLELFHSTGDKSWLDDARRGADELISRLPAMDAAKDAGLYTGLGGALFVLEETHRATGDGKYRDGAKQALAMIHGQAQKTTLGAAWQGPSATYDIISGSAGIGLALLWADQMIGDKESRILALAAGRHLMDVGIAEKGGTKWPVAQDAKTLYPNFSHGTAGVAYYLATLLKMTGERSLLAGALAGAKYLQSIADTSNGGFKVFHHEPGGENLYYMSWCHGPAGTARLYHRLAQITGRARWEEIAYEGAKATIDSGAPEKQSPGYWNNISQCCGNAGVGEFFISLQRRSPSAQYQSMIDRVRANTLSRATTEGDGLKWVQAENRVSPNEVVAQTGYKQGAAGVGSFYLHADALAKGRKSPIIWPDSVDFDPCVAGAPSSASDMSNMNGGKAYCK